MLLIFQSAVHNESFQLNYLRFNSTQSKNNHNNRGFTFPFRRKKSFTIFTYRPQRAQRPVIIIANLKKGIRVKASRPLVSLRKHEVTTHRLRGNGNYIETTV